MYQAELVQEETDRRQTTDPATETVLAELVASYPVISYPAVQEEENGHEATLGEAGYPGLVMRPHLWS